MYVTMNRVRTSTEPIEGAGIVGEGLEEDRRRVQLAATPPRPDVEKLGPGDAEEEDGSGA